MKKIAILVFVFLGAFIFTQSASATVVYSTKASCSTHPKMRGSVYFKGKLFSSKGKTKVRLTKIFYRLGPAKSSSDKNDILLGKKKGDSSYYKSPDSFLRNGKKQSKKIKKKVIVPFFKALTFTINFDEFWSDPDCSNTIIFNFNGLKGQKPR